MANQKRRKHLVTGTGVSLWRSMQRGEVRAGPELARFIRDLVGELRDARGVGDSLGSWGGWAVRRVLDEQRAAEASRGGVASFLAEVGVESLREYVQRCTVTV